MNPNDVASGGLSALFDLSFTKFITVTWIKFIYLILLAFAALAWLVFVIGGFMQGFLPGIGALIAGTIILGLNILGARILLEMVVIFVRIGTNTARIADQLAPQSTSFPVVPPPSA